MEILEEKNTTPEQTCSWKKCWCDQIFYFFFFFEILASFDKNSHHPNYQYDHSLSPASHQSSGTSPPDVNSPHELS